METGSRIYVAGAETPAGAALVRELERRGHTNLVGQGGDKLELRDPRQVDDFFGTARPEYVFLTGGRTGGIGANRSYPAELMLDNLLVQCHVVHNAYVHGAKKLLYVASSCTYPRHCAQPMKEEYLLTGDLEPTNEAYALAKIAGIKLCQAYAHQYGANFLAVIAGDVFGPGDDFSPEDSHVVGALIGKMHEAKVRDLEYVEVWGTGTPRREFIFVDDLARACLFLMAKYDSHEPINVSSGAVVSIADLAQQIKDAVGYQGALRFNTDRPDGMPMKSLDSSRLRALGWSPETSLASGLKATYSWFLKVHGGVGASHVR